MSAYPFLRELDRSHWLSSRENGCIKLDPSDGVLLDQPHPSIEAYLKQRWHGVR